MTVSEKMDHSAQNVIIGTEVNLVKLQVNVPKDSMLLLAQERERYVLFTGCHAPSTSCPVNCSYTDVAMDGRLLRLFVLLVYKKQPKLYRTAMIRPNSSLLLTFTLSPIAQAS